VAVPMFSLVVPVLGAILVVAGAILIKRGHWPRRTGTTAHCRVCDYILTPGQSRCPECGTAADEDTVVRGRRRRRPAVTGSGAALALFGVMLLAVFLTGMTGTVDWNRHKPLGWLLRDLDTPATSGPAWAEIQRRLADGLLSDADQSTLVDKGLHLQTSGVSLLSGNNILDFVGQRFLDHKLTESQADRFFAAAMKISLAMRTVVGAQSPLSYSIVGAGRGPGGWSLRMTTLEAQVDDGPVQKQGGSTSGYFGGWSTSTVLPPVPSPGKHRLRVKVELATAASAAGIWNDNAPVARRVKQDLFADFQVVEGATPIESETTPTADALARLLRTRLSLEPDGRFLDFEVDSNGLPVDAAFDVYARFDGHEQRLGGVCLRKGVNGGHTGIAPLTSDLPATVDLVFRASEPVARETVDLTRIWKGELVLAGVPVHRAGGRN